MMVFNTRQSVKYRELCRNRVIRLLNRWYHDAEGFLLLATLEEQQEAIDKLGEQLTTDVAAIGWNESLEFFGI